MKLLAILILTLNLVLFPSMKTNSEGFRSIKEDTTRKDSSIIYETPVKRVESYYDFEEYKSKVSGGESHNKYWVWQFYGGPACGKYQMEALARKIVGYGHINKYNFVKAGYREGGSDEINKKVFDKLWPEEEQEQAMDSLCNYVIHWLEIKSGKTLDKFVEDINDRKIYPVEITDAMVLGAIHFTGLEKFIWLTNHGSYYTYGNAYGYTVWNCMLRYKGVKMKKERIIWNVKKLKPKTIRMRKISPSMILIGVKKNSSIWIKSN